MRSKLSLLLIEDDASLLDELSIFLEDFFEIIDVATNAEDAYEKFVVTTYDLVITDIQLPKQNGLEFVEKIKKKKPSQYVIVISAYKEVDYFLKSIELGIYSFLTKPFNSQQLINTMIKVTTILHHLNHIVDTQIIRLHPDVSFDSKTKELHVKGELSLLTLKEELLLSFLVKNRDVPVRNEQIMQEVWQSDGINDSTLRALVKRLRDKLGYADAISNLKNRGYKLNTKD
ncbi:MAG: response regulator transcription factor [Sulfurospirillaceae bacterium]|nr:response regulator transcription factor [Sulfurospirillaceae bacterium]MDD2826080.1 response regulator transcription factor [Sulfurospirillaceae bacterium]